MSNLVKLWDFLMEWEGRSFENDPADPGGATKYGIDQRSHPNVVIRDLTEDKAKEIYEKEWDEQVPSVLLYPSDIVFFNYCVNTGRGRAVKFLQKALGVDVDGDFGLKTSSAVVGKDPVSLAKSIIDAADAFYVALNKPRFQRGWLNRDAALRKLIS
jgi:lysozyme family protein